MTSRRRPPDDPGFDPVFGESAHLFTPEERLSMELYLVNLRRGLQACPGCGERKRAWSNRLCLSCGGPGGYSKEALAALGEPYASEMAEGADSGRAARPE